MGQPQEISSGESILRAATKELCKMSIPLTADGTQDLVLQSILTDLDIEYEAILKHSFSEIGRVLQKAMDTLPRGEYEKWITEKGMSRTTAWRYRKIYADPECFKVKHFKMKEVPQIEGPDEEEKASRPAIFSMFDNDADADEENGTNNDLYEPPLEPGEVHGTATLPEAHEPRTVQRGNGHMREAKQEYNKKEPWDKAELMARAKPVVKDAPTKAGVRIYKPEIDRADYIGNEFLIDYIGDLMEQACEKKFGHELQEMLIARGFFQRKEVAV
jgi:hypothetical protein